MKLHKMQLTELQAADPSHAAMVESLQHQVNSVRGQPVSGLSADVDVIRQRQQDSNRRNPHGSHEFVASFDEQPTLTTELRHKIKELK